MSSNVVHFNRNSNGKFSMASITSQADYDGIMKVYNSIAWKDSYYIILGGARNDTSDASRNVWSWDDGSVWDNDIASGKTIPNCGWGPGEPKLFTVN